MSLTLTVSEWNENYDEWEDTRKATEADLVEILPTIGAENVWWCERHSCGGQPAHCSYGFSHKIEDVCRMIPVLVLKVEDR